MGKPSFRLEDIVGELGGNPRIVSAYMVQNAKKGATASDKTFFGDSDDCSCNPQCTCNEKCKCVSVCGNHCYCVGESESKCAYDCGCQNHDCNTYVSGGCGEEEFHDSICVLTLFKHCISKCSCADADP
jgi:hypothetical protein